MQIQTTILYTSLFAAIVTAAPATAADYTCNGLVPLGQKMVCPGFEPNWAIELICDGEAMTSNFIDAFSGAEITETPGSVSFSAENPWTFETSHPVTGSIAYTPGACTDEGDNVYNFTLTPSGAPGLSPPFFPFCCRFEPTD